MNKIKKTDAASLIPGDVFHPGEFLKDEIQARGMRQANLVNVLGLSKSEISLIIHGKRNITVHVAIKLEELLGIDAEIWMNLQIAYEINKVKIQLKNKLKIRQSLKNKGVGIQKLRMRV